MKDKLGHELKYSLQEWCIAYAVRPVKDTGDLVGIYQGDTIPCGAVGRTGNLTDIAWELHHLTDYVVSSVSGGVVWLVRREQ